MRRRFALRGSVLAAILGSGAALLSGCSAEREMNMGSVVVMAPVRAAAPAAQRAPLRASQVDPAFTAAVGAYARQVMGLRDLGPAATDAQIRRALELLANAVELTPGRYGPSAPSAAQQIRADAGLMMFGLRLGPEGTRPVVHALEVSAGALGELANQAYGQAPAVQERVAGLHHAVALIRATSGDIRPPREEVISALEQAALVLTAMHAAAGQAPGEGARQ